MLPPSPEAGYAAWKCASPASLMPSRDSESEAFVDKCRDLLGCARTN